MVPERSIWLPRSCARNTAPSYLRLLERVKRSDLGYLFEGQILTPGKRVKEAVLYPPGFPISPILLECAGTAGGRGHARGECFYLLWRYHPDDGFVTIARAASRAWEWSIDLGPIAGRLLEESARSASAPEEDFDLAPMECRIRKAIECELAHLELEDRRRLMAVLADSIASRLAREAAA